MIEQVKFIYSPLGKELKALQILKPAEQLKTKSIDNIFQNISEIVKLKKN